MEYSQAQDKICPSCEKSELTEWKCLHCESFLCGTCIKGHSNIGHDVIRSTDFRARKESRPKLKKLSCHDHGDDTIKFCASCRTPVCPKCLDIDNSHKNHKLEIIEKLYDDKMNNLDIQTKTIIRDILPESVDNIEKLKYFQDYHERRFEEEKPKILAHYELLRAKLKESSDKILQQLKEEFEQNNKIVTEQKVKMEQVESELRNTLKYIKTSQLSGDFEVILKTEEKVQICIENHDTSVSLPQETLCFSAPLLDNNTLNSVIGTLIPCNFVSDNFNAKIAKSVSMDFRCDKTSSVACCGDTIYIGSYYYGVREVLDREKGIRKIAKIYPIDIDVLKSGEVIFSDRKQVSKVDINMEIVPLCTFSLFRSPKALCVCKNGKIMVLLNHLFDDIKIILVLSPDGKQIDTIKLDEGICRGGKVRICENLNGHILISSGTSNYVKDFNSDGKVYWKKFELKSPEDIATTSLGNVIISDLSGLHILDPCGKMLMIVDVEKLRIHDVPRAMSFKTDKDLVVLCGAQVLILKLSTII